MANKGVDTEIAENGKIEAVLKPDGFTVTGIYR
jgi:hypothetical protein